MTVAIAAARFLVGWDDRDRRSPTIHVAFPSDTDAHRMRAAIHRLAADVDDASPSDEAWRTEVSFYTPNEQRHMGLGGRVAVRLASYTSAEIEIETARVTAVFEAVLARHR